MNHSARVRGLAAQLCFAAAHARRSESTLPPEQWSPLRSIAWFDAQYGEVQEDWLKYAQQVADCAGAGDMKKAGA